MNKSLANHDEIVTKPMIGVHCHGSWTSVRHSSRSDSSCCSQVSLDEPTFRAAALKEDEKIITPKLPRHQGLERRPYHLADVFCWPQPRRCSLDHSSFPARLPRRGDAVRCAAVSRSLSLAVLILRKGVMALQACSSTEALYAATAQFALNFQWRQSIGSFPRYLRDDASKVSHSRNRCSCRAGSLRQVVCQRQLKCNPRYRVARLSSHPQRENHVKLINPALE
jgi:hypothetical protein